MSVTRQALNLYVCVRIVGAQRRTCNLCITHLLQLFVVLIFCQNETFLFFSIDFFLCCLIQFLLCLNVLRANICVSPHANSCTHSLHLCYIPVKSPVWIPVTEADVFGLRGTRRSRPPDWGTKERFAQTPRTVVAAYQWFGRSLT